MTAFLTTVPGLRVASVAFSTRVKGCLTGDRTQANICPLSSIQGLPPLRPPRNHKWAATSRRASPQKNRRSFLKRVLTFSQQLFGVPGPMHSFSARGRGNDLGPRSVFLLPALVFPHLQLPSTGPGPLQILLHSSMTQVVAIPASQADTQPQELM